MFGSIVLSKAGRDKDNVFLVSKVEDNYVYIVDGDIHKIENPKYKKIKHLEETAYFDEHLSNRIKNNNKVTNQDIKRCLKKISIHS